MTDQPSPEEIFFTQGELDQGRIGGLVDEALHGADDGELFLEYRQSESFSFDDGRLKNASFDTNQGFGLRAVCGESTGYAHATELSEKAIGRAVATVQAVRAGHDGSLAESPPRTNRALYSAVNPLDEVDFAAKVALLADMDAYARDSDSRVRQVVVSLTGSWQAVSILRQGGVMMSDVRPLVRLNVTVMAGQGDRLESGSHGVGGRCGYQSCMKPENWRAQVDEVLRQALVNLEARPAPAGEMAVVMGPGWPEIMLHEAIGHGLEGDFNRKKTSAFSGLMGQRVASEEVTVIDDGTIADRRGSLTIDDEGTPAQNTVLIEDGILTGLIQDRMNARLMGTRSTGNGRRQSFAHAPMPRMTNTYMMAGSEDPEDIIRSVDKGIYATTFGGGQVDITSGKFVFSCTEAYLIEGGKIGPPVKGATLIGNGPDVLGHVSMVGADMELDPGIGTCGKEGQSVPVGVGQPTIEVDQLTVGGTAV